MKKVLFIAVGSAALALAANIAGADLLSDPGFENAGSGAWSPYVSHVNFQTDFDATASVHGGAEALEVIWTSTIPQWNIFEAKQDVAVTAGQAWDASVYARITSPLNNAEAYLETIFYDIGSTEVGKQSSTHLSAATDWTQLSTSGAVSNNAVSARYRLVVFTSGGDSSSGTMYFDDASATAVIPEPATAAFLGLALLLLRPVIGRKKS